MSLPEETQQNTSTVSPTLANGEASTTVLKIFLRDLQCWILSTAKLCLRFVLCCVAESCVCLMRSASSRRNAFNRASELYIFLCELFSVFYLCSVLISFGHRIVCVLTYVLGYVAEALLIIVKRISGLPLFKKVYESAKRQSDDFFSIMNVSLCLQRCRDPHHQTNKPSRITSRWAQDFSVTPKKYPLALLKPHPKSRKVKHSLLGSWAYCYCQRRWQKSSCHRRHVFNSKSVTKFFSKCAFEEVPCGKAQEVLQAAVFID